jgi:hypothetical protein
MDLNNEIDAVVARLSAGEDPRPILVAFAEAVRGAGRVVVKQDVFKCLQCRTPDAVCFKCKAVSMVGEQGVLAIPMLASKLGPMISGWAAERKAKKEAEAQAQAQQEAAARHATQQAQRNQARRAPPPPGGPQRF